MISMNSNLNTAITASIDAGKAMMEIYQKTSYSKQYKEDNSPLTEADLAASKIINAVLEKTDYPIISEEIKNQEYAKRQSWNTCWVVDPLDGTKEFIKKNGEFTVNIALCTNGKPTLGVIYVPVSRELYYADVTKNIAYKSILDENHAIKEDLFDQTNRIFKSKVNNKIIRLVGSRSHMNQATHDYISTIEVNYEKVEIVSKGSSLKFCLVAEGIADIYPRFAPTMEWDTAAGHAICNAVGLKVISQETNKELLYNKENLLNPHFLVSQ